MKTIKINTASQGTSRRPVDWWYQANTAGFALSGLWGPVLLEPAIR